MTLVLYTQTLGYSRLSLIDSQGDGLLGHEDHWRLKTKKLIRITGQQVPFPAQYRLLHSYCSKFTFTEKLQPIKWQHSLLNEQKLSDHIRQKK